MERGPARIKKGLIDSPVSLELTEKIIRAFFAVNKELGHGFLEAVYVNALLHELADCGLSAVREVPIEVVCKGRPVGFYRADILVESQIILEVKSCAQIGPADHRQLINYLTATDITLGYLMHFGYNAKYFRYVSTGTRRRP